MPAACLVVVDLQNDFCPGYLRERGIRELQVCGLATDFCVASTALDARAAGFEVAAGVQRK